MKSGCVTQACSAFSVTPSDAMAYVPFWSNVSYSSVLDYLPVISALPTIALFILAMIVTLDCGPDRALPLIWLSFPLIISLAYATFIVDVNIKRYFEKNYNIEQVFNDINPLMEPLLNGVALPVCIDESHGMTGGYLSDLCSIRVVDATMPMSGNNQATQASFTITSSSRTGTVSGSLSAKRKDLIDIMKCATGYPSLNSINQAAKGK